MKSLSYGLLEMLVPNDSKQGEWCGWGGVRMGRGDWETST